MSVSGQRTPAAGNPHVNHDDKVRVNKPDTFTGDRNKLDDWLTQMEVYFAFYPTPEGKKTLFATTFLRERAQHWFKPMLRLYLDDGKDDSKYFAKFDYFKKGIRQIFGVSNEEKAAERVIQHLNQKSSASDYAARFQEYANLTEWDDASLMTMFRRGLKQSVKAELMRYSGRITSMEELIEASIEMDDKLYELSMEERFDKVPRGRSGTYTNGPSNSYRTKPHHGKSDSYGHMPMELDVTERRSGRKPKGRQANSKQKLCYGCGKPGHFARDCRSRNNNLVQRRQINATLRKEPEDWEEITQEENEDDSPDTLDPSSDDDYYLVDSPEELQKVLDGNAQGKAPASTQEVNSSLRQDLAERPRTPYPYRGQLSNPLIQRVEDLRTGVGNAQHQEDMVVPDTPKLLPLEETASDMEYEWDQDLEETMTRMDYQVDYLERELGSNANTEVEIPKPTRQQLESMVLYDGNIGLPMHQRKPNGITYPPWLQEEDTSLQRFREQHKGWHWTTCKEPMCAIHYEAKNY